MEKNFGDNKETAVDLTAVIILSFISSTHKSPVRKSL